MTEAFLQYVWQHQLICTDKLFTTDNEEVSIIKVGTFNSNAGPDFLNAKIKIGKTIWFGDIEIHVKSSDWDLHRHYQQESYNSVILHVVASYDKDVYSSRKQKIPTIILPILPHVTYNYTKLSDIPCGIRCEKQIHTVDTFRITMFLERLVAERFEDKSNKIIELYHKNNNDWETSFYQQLAKSFGFKINSDAFENLAQNLPLRLLEKHRNDLFIIESLLFGQANIWSSNPDEYETCLQKEYKFLQKKYSLTPISSTWWKFARMRPHNFPTMKIAQLAKLLHSTNSLVSMILDINSLQEFRNLFTCEASDYWKNHFVFGKQSSHHQAILGGKSIEIIIINTVVPFLYAYGKERNDMDIRQKAYNLLMEIPPEQNFIVTMWKKCNIKPHNAYDSQGLIQLFNNYCKSGNCIHCNIGHIILKKSFHQTINNTIFR